MTALMTEIAIQMKGALSFLLGLGAFFSMTRSALTAQIGLPRLTEEERRRRATLKVAVERMRQQLLGWTLVMAALFVAALVLYLGPLETVDPDALRTGKARLTPGQRWAVAGIAFIAIAFLAIDTYLVVRKQALQDLLARHRG